MKKKIASFAKKKSYTIFQVQKQLHPIRKQFYYLSLKIYIKSKKLVYYRTAHI